MFVYGLSTKPQEWREGKQAARLLAADCRILPRSEDRRPGGFSWRFSSAAATDAVAATNPNWAKRLFLELGGFLYFLLCTLLSTSSTPVVPWEEVEAFGPDHTLSSTVTTKFATVPYG